ncbi:MAG TPA: class I SAM-dependent methyltransferase [Labilithrix sp.]
MICAERALEPVAKTMFIPLWARAVEMRKRRPLVRDLRAAEICADVAYDFGTLRHAYGTQIGCVLRGMLYDAWVAGWLARNPGGTIVELGAGLTTRFDRIDDGRAHWVDVDLPHAIALRRRYFAPAARRELVAASVVDPRLPDAIKRAAPPPYLFVSEGMLMYLDPAEVRALFRRLADAFAPTEIAFDSIAPIVVRHQRLHDSMRHMMDAPFRWGIKDARDIGAWDRRVCVEESATLPEIARRFRHRVPVRQRLAGALVERAMPPLARAYRVSRAVVRA